MAAQRAATEQRSRPKTRKIDADPGLRRRVVDKLRAGASPDQVAGRLRYELPGQQAGWVSYEAIYTWIYALPTGELDRLGILLRTGRTRRRSRGRTRSPGARIVGMTSIDARPAEVADRAVPGHGEGDLMIGKAGTTAMATLVERTFRYTVPVSLPAGRRDTSTTCDALITTVTGMPTQLVKTLTWDQGSEMAAHAAFSLATEVAVYFAHPHSPRGTRHQREHQRTAPRVFPQGHRDHRRPNLPRPRGGRTQQPATPYPGLPNPSRNLRRTPGRLNCFHRLTPPCCSARMQANRRDRPGVTQRGVGTSGSGWPSKPRPSTAPTARSR